MYSAVVFDRELTALLVFNALLPFNFVFAAILIIPPYMLRNDVITTRLLDAYYKGRITEE